MKFDKNIIPLFNYVKDNSNIRARVDIDTALLDNRVVYFNGSVNLESCSNVIKKLLLLSYDDSNADIKLFINTGGGNIYDALCVADVIDTLPCKVITIGVGHIYSAGVLLICAGTQGYRSCFTNTDFLIHQPSINVQKGALTYSDIKSRYDSLGSSYDSVFNFLLKRTGIEKLELKRLMSSDNFFGSQQALKYKLINYIISSNNNKDSLKK